MPTVTADDLRNMKPLRTANHTVGNPARTAEMITEDGYLYFKDVLDHEAIARLKQKYLDVLVEMGVVDAGATEPVWNGTDLSEFPVKIEPLHDMKAWESFVAEPRVHDFFNRLLGTEPFWLPIVEYRITRPARPSEIRWSAVWDVLQYGDGLLHLLDPADGDRRGDRPARRHSRAPHRRCPS